MTGQEQPKAQLRARRIWVVEWRNSGGVWESCPDSRWVILAAAKRDMRLKKAQHAGILYRVRAEGQAEPSPEGRDGK